MDKKTNSGVPSLERDASDIDMDIRTLQLGAHKKRTGRTGPLTDEDWEYIMGQRKELP